MERHTNAADYRSWTIPGEVALLLKRRWSRGELLSAYVTGKALFPMSVPIRAPGLGALSTRPEEVRRWIFALEAESRTQRGLGYDIHWAPTAGRRMGAPSRLPASLIIPSAADALHLIDKTCEAQEFEALVGRTLDVHPGLRAWLAKHALRAIRYARDWDRFLSVVSWFQAHPRSGVYLRQIELPNADYTFIQKHRRLIGELLNEVLPRGAIDPSAAMVRSFEKRYGLLSTPPMVRMRLLDHKHALGGFTDVSVPISELAMKPFPVARVFIVDSEMNGLSFPDTPDSIAIFGLGLQSLVLAQVPWLRDRALYYWSSIDLQGFARLDRLRTAFPAVRSLLMDRDTFLVNKEAWTSATFAHQRAAVFERLTAAEHSLVSDLIDGRFGGHVRLEQERVSYRWLHKVLGEIQDGSNH
jgi:hypothetical protein